MLTDIQARKHRALVRTINQLVELHLSKGDVCFTITRGSMQPALAPGDRVIVRRVCPEELRLSDIVLMKAGNDWLAHRLVARRAEDGQRLLITKGDNSAYADAPWHISALVGVVVAVQRRGRTVNMQSMRARMSNALFVLISQSQRLARRVLPFLAIVLAMFLILPIPRVSAAVTVSSFGAQGQATQVQVTWTTASEINNAGFNLLRSSSSGGTYTQINSNLIRNQCFGCILGATYPPYIDTSVVPGQTYYYKLQSVSTGGGTQLYGPVSAKVSAPIATPTATPVATPVATQTSISSTTTQSSAVATTSASGNTAAPPTATLPSNSRGTLSAAVSPTAPATQGVSTSSTQSRIPTRVAMLVQPTSPSITDDATPDPSLVAIAIKQVPPETSEEQSAETAHAPDQSYYVRDLVSGGVILSLGILLAGAIALGAASLYFFLRGYLRE